MTVGQEAGWYPDPWAPGQRRYWDGAVWTADVFADGVHGTAGSVLSSTPFGPPPTEHASVPPAPPVWRSPAPAPWVPDLDLGYSPAEELSTPSAPSPWRVVAVVLAACLVLGAGAFGLVRLLSPDEQQPVAQSTPAATAPPSTPSPSPAPSTPPGTTPITPPSTAPSAPPTGPSTRPTGPGASQGPGGTAPAGSVVARIGLQQSDVVSSVTVGLIVGGDQVTGQTTLDLCTGTFPSESLRTQRYQVVGVDPVGAPLLSTEAVQYRSAAATAQAFTEIAAVAARCPSTPLGTPPVTTTLGPRPDTSWPTTPGVARLAYAVSTTSADGTSESSVVVYLRHGNLLMGVYFPHPSGAQTPVDGKTTIPEIVHIFEQRLLNPPTSGISG